MVTGKNHNMQEERTSHERRENGSHNVQSRTGAPPPIPLKKALGASDEMTTVGRMADLMWLMETTLCVLRRVIVKILKSLLMTGKGPAYRGSRGAMGVDMDEHMGCLFQSLIGLGCERHIVVRRKAGNGWVGHAGECDKGPGKQWLMLEGAGCR